MKFFTGSYFKDTCHKVKLPALNQLLSLMKAGLVTECQFARYSPFMPTFGELFLQEVYDKHFSNWQFDYVHDEFWRSSITQLFAQ